VSTTFQVYPGTDHIPTFGAVLDLGTRYLHDYPPDHRRDPAPPRSRRG